MKASMLIAIADNDDQKEPTSKDIRREAFERGLRRCKGSAEIEVYQGANYGWMPPDSQNHNAATAERGWERKLALFKKALAKAQVEHLLRADQRDDDAGTTPSSAAARVACRWDFYAGLLLLLNSVAAPTLITTIPPERLATRGADFRREFSETFLPSD
jgi:hypothetical protein